MRYVTLQRMTDVNFPGVGGWVWVELRSSQRAKSDIVHIPISLLAVLRLVSPSITITKVCYTSSARPLLQFWFDLLEVPAPNLEGGNQEIQHQGRAHFGG